MLSQYAIAVRRETFSRLDAADAVDSRKEKRVFVGSFGVKWKYFWCWDTLVTNPATRCLQDRRAQQYPLHFGGHVGVWGPTFRGRFGCVLFAGTSFSGPRHPFAPKAVPKGAKLEGQGSKRHVQRVLVEHTKHIVFIVQEAHEASWDGPESDLCSVRSRTPSGGVLGRFFLNFVDLGAPSGSHWGTSVVTNAYVLQSQCFD